MTAPRSTLRSRRRPPSEGVPQGDIYAAMRAAGKDAAVWEALRPHAVRVLAGKVGTVEQAARIFAAYRSRPHLLPGPPPRSHQQAK